MTKEAIALELRLAGVDTLHDYYDLISRESKVYR